jgi:AcrR family transcriptional regulator
MAAASELLQQGVTPTIAQTAEAAGVSKSTAYRYFPSQEVFLAEVLLDKTVKQELAAVYAAAQLPGSGEARLAAVIKADHALVIKHERAFRAALRVMMAPASEQEEVDTLPRRPGNRLRYLAEALKPLQGRLSTQQLERLVMALSLCVGLESILVLKDICGLSTSAAEQVKTWATMALLQASLREGPDST